MYGRALEAGVRREPDWQHVGARLGRGATECRFMYTSMRTQWQKQHPRGATAGASAGQLAGGGAQLDALARDAGIDAPTMAVLRRLADPPEPALAAAPAARRLVRRRWTAQDDEDLARACPLHRPPTAAELADYMRRTGRTREAAYLRYYVRIARRPPGSAPRPLSARERRVIAQAAARCRPHETVRWGDVCADLPGRSFAEVAGLVRASREPVVV